MATEKLRYIISADTKGFNNALKALGAAVTAAFVAAIKITADFEAQLSKVEAVTNATAEEMAALEKEARRLGKSTAYSASEVASLEFELAKLGFTTNEIINSAGGILNLASALGVDLSDAAVLAGSSIRSFGLSTEDTGRVTDVLAKAASSSALDFGKLTESLKDAAPIAKLYNFTIEDTVAMLGVLANAGIHGSKAGVALRNIFLELDKKGISLNEALKKVNESANPAATALELVGKRSGGALAIIAQNQGKVQGLADELYNAAGAAEEMRKKMEDNLHGDFAKLTSAASELGIVVGQELDWSLRQLTQTITDMLSSQAVSYGIITFFYKIKKAALEAAWGLNFVSMAFQKGPFGLGSVTADTLLAFSRIEEALKNLDKDYFSKLAALADPDFKVVDLIKPPSRTNNTVGAGGGGGGTGGGSSSSGNTGGIPNSFFNPDFLNSSDFQQWKKEQTSGVEEVTDSWINGQTAVVGFMNALNSLNEGGFKGFAKSLIQTAQSIATAMAITAATKDSVKFGAVALPALIAVALGVVGSAFSKVGGGASAGRSVSASIAATPYSATPAQSEQGRGGTNQLVATVRGQDLRFALQNANAVYGQTS